MHVQAAVQMSMSTVCDQESLGERSGDYPEHAPKNDDEQTYPNCSEIGYNCKAGRASHLPVVTTSGHGRQTASVGAKVGLATPSELARPSPAGRASSSGAPPQTGRSRRRPWFSWKVGSPLPWLIGVPSSTKSDHESGGHGSTGVGCSLGRSWGQSWG